MSFLAATKARRSITALKNESPIPDKQIVEIVQHAILHAPSPFNVQSCRAIVLFKKEHEKLWDVAKETLQATVPPAQMAFFEPKLKEYRGAYGTVRPSIPFYPVCCHIKYLLIGLIFFLEQRRSCSSKIPPRPKAYLRNGEIF